MARYLAVYTGARWMKIPEVAGKIRVFENTTGNYDVKIVKEYTGSAWATVWEIPPPPHVTPPHVPAGSHARTISVTIHHIVGVNTARWTIPTSHHVTHQTLTYYTGLSTAPHKHTKTVTPAGRHTTVLTGAWGATLRYTYT